MERDKLDFGNEKINKLFGAMFLPTLIGMVFNSILNICDGMFVSYGVGSNALAAINIVHTLFLVCTGVGLMFGIGAPGDREHQACRGERQGGENHNDTGIYRRGYYASSG